MLWGSLFAGLVLGVACTFAAGFFLAHLTRKAGTDHAAVVTNLKSTEAKLKEARRYLTFISSASSLQHAQKIAHKAIKETD